MKEQYKQLANTVIKPVKFNGNMKRCSHCNEFFKEGFYLDDLFYCKKCTVDDFKNFLIIRKEVEE